MILAVLRGFFSFIQALQNLDQLDQYKSRGVPGWFGPINYVVILLAIILLISAFLLITRRRMGLYLGLAGFGGDLVSGIIVVLLLIGANVDISGLTGTIIIQFAIDGIVIYYLLKHLYGRPTKESSPSVRKSVRTGVSTMQRRTFLTFIVLTAIISVATTVIVLSAISPQSQSQPQERLVTFIVKITTTPGSTQTPYIITVLPAGVADVPTGVFETPDLTRSPVATIDAEALDANPAAQGTVTSLPENCIPHVIEEGDTPFGIAELYGVNGFTLMAVNGLTEETATLLQVGDVIIVPLPGCELEPPPTSEPSNTPAASTAGGEETEEPEFTLTPSPSPTITLAPTAANAQIEIVDVVSRGDITAEAVRIRNLGETVNVTGWTLSDSDGNVYEFPKDQLIFSNAEVTVYTRTGQNTPVVFFWGRDTAVWNPGDVLTLTDNNGRVQATQRLP